MIGSIILPYKAPLPPPWQYDYFDPETQTATEENFIRLLNDEIYSADIIGMKVQTSTVTYVIADVNHDSENTGQTNCYDLISTNQSGSNGVFSSMSPYTYYNSNPRSDLINTRSGFYANKISDNLKTHLINLKYNSEGVQYNDQVVLPSFIEMNGTTATSSTSYLVEGVPYPIFTDNNSRILTSSIWQTRSRRCSSTSSTTNYIQMVYGSNTSAPYAGGLSSQNGSNYNASYIALIRVQ